MVQRLKKLFKTHKALWLALFVFFAGTFTLLDTGRHFAFNLEPYPDGIFYTLPAWNFVQGNGFSMHFNSSEINTPVPPLYSLLLIPFYAAFPTPVAFYALNVLLGVLTLSFLFFLLTENVKNKWSEYLLPLFAMLPVILWLPAVPMAENLLLPLSTALIWLWQTKKISMEKKMIPLLMLQTALFFTKYAAFAFLIPFNLLFFWELYQSKNTSLLRRYILTGLSLLAAYILIFRPSFILTVFRPQTETKTGTQLIAFSWQYLPQNIFEYLKSVLGISAFFLWQKIALIPAGIVLIPFAVSIMSQKTAQQILIRKLLFFLGSVLILQSFFYAADTRYIITLLPIVWLAIGISMDTVSKKNRIFLFLILSLSAAALVFSQKNFYRQLIGSNWLQRSVAWQYQAVLSLRQFDFPADSSLITALPPYLFSFYYPDHPQLLPLSSSQEFMNEGQRPWGNDVQYEDLETTYRTLLEQGQQVYISNAYLTYSQKSVEDFEQYRKKFQFTLVSEGCEQTCNIYQLTGLAPANQ